MEKPGFNRPAQRALSIPGIGGEAYQEEPTEEGGDRWGKNPAPFLQQSL